MSGGQGGQGRGREPIETPREQRLAELRGTPTTVGVWTIAVIAIVVILAGRAREFEYIGLARTTQYEISPDVAGRVDRVLVGLYEAVESGAVVATLDAAGVRARLKTARAELARLGAELDAVASGTDADRLDQRADLRRFDIDVEDRRLESLGLRVTIESDEVEAQRLGLTLRRMRDLHWDGVISDEELDDVRLRHREVTTRITENRVLLARLAEEYDAALERKRDFERSLPFATDDAGILAPLRLSVEVQERRVDEIQVEREALVLRAPVAGKVSALLGTPGQAVRPGEAIAMVAPGVASEVVGYAPTTEAATDPTGRTVILYRATDPDRVLESVVLRVSPAIEVLPEQLWRRPGRAEYGRAFTVAAGAGLGLLPGEPVHIRMRTGE